MHSAKTHSPVPKGNVFIIGPEGSGKTSFLGGLSLMGTAGHPSGVSVVGLCAQDETTTNTAQELLTEIRRQMQSQEWPQATTTVAFLRYRVVFRGRAVDLSFLDYPGEELREALNLLSPALLARVVEHLHAADFLLLLLDPEVDLPGLVQRNEGVAICSERLQAHIHGLFEILNRRGTNGARAAVGIAVTKSDLFPELQNVETLSAHIERTMKPFVERVVELSGAPPRYFAFSSVGHVEEAMLPEGGRYVRPVRAEDLAPSGYEAFLDWIVRTQDARRWRPFALAARIAALIALVVGSLLAYWQHATVSDVLDSKRPLRERIHAAGRVPLQTRAARDAVHRLVGGELATLRERLDVARDGETLTQLEHAAAQLPGVRFSDMDKSVAQFREEIRERSRGLSLKSVEAMPQGPARRTALMNFIKNYPGTPESDQAKRALERQVAEENRAERSRIRSLPLNNADALIAKASEMQRYVREFQQFGVVPDAKEILDASDVANRLATQRQFETSIKRAGILKESRSMMLKIWVADKAHEARSKGKTDDARDWDPGTFILDWSVGGPVFLQLLADTSGIGVSKHEPLAERSSNSALAIALLGENHDGEESVVKLEPTGVGKKYIKGEPSVRLNVKDYSKTDWKLLADFLEPGERW